MRNVNIISADKINDSPVIAGAVLDSYHVAKREVRDRFNVQANVVSSDCGLENIQVEKFIELHPAAEFYRLVTRKIRARKSRGRHALVK